MRIRSFVQLSLALNLLIAAAWGQESRAIINGTVTDPQGAVVPSAISNAVFDAIGVRLRSVPFTPDKVKAMKGTA